MRFVHVASNLKVVRVRLLVAVGVRRVGDTAVSSGETICLGPVAGISLVRLVGGVVGADCGSGVCSLAAGTGVDIGTSNRARGGSARTVGTELGVAVVDGAPAVALPEGGLLAAAGSVVVRGRRTVTLLLLGAAREPELADSGDEEEETTASCEHD